uniref:ZAD domain-containing protein n=1 Tax=Homalodisca liturata TaxID=320908 RepID=A0A1B6IXS0_9HEMI
MICLCYTNNNKMGSLDNAVITGFICRLCSEMSRFVIHIYGEEGARLQLAKKINEYLPINVHFDDPLPKTVCSRCISKLELQHELIERCKKTNYGLHGRTRSVPT